MRKVILGLALLGAVAVGTTAQAATPYQGPATVQPLGTSAAQPMNPYDGRATVQPVYWNGGYCGPRCQAHQWRRHQRWEARRDLRHRRWEERRWEGRRLDERRYGYYAYPRY
jgi:hypothetical protein